VGLGGRFPGRRAAVGFAAALLLVGGAGIAAARTLLAPDPPCPTGASSAVGPADASAGGPGTEVGPCEPGEGTTLEEPAPADADGSSGGSAEDATEEAADEGSAPDDPSPRGPSPEDCEGALQLDLGERSGLAAVLEEGGGAGLAHAIEVVLANCQEHPNHGLVNALGRLAANRQRHAEHEAWRAEREAAREAARAEREAARAAGADRAGPRGARPAAVHAGAHPGRGRP
jgi:hypothetical protein